MSHLIKDSQIRYKQVIILLYFIIIVLVPNHSFAQVDRIEQIKHQLDQIDSIAPGLNDQVSFTMTSVSIQELVRNLAQLNQLNITIDPTIQVTVTNNFSEVPAKELILFLCKQYNLKIEITGSIIAITKFESPKIVSTIPKRPKISFDTENNLLSMDLKNDSLNDVLKEITNLTGINTIATSDLANKKVSCFIDNSETTIALKKFAFANDLEAYEDEGYYIFKSKLQEIDPKSKSRGRSTENQDDKLYFVAKSMDDISLNAVNVPIGEIISTISNSLKVNYFIFSKLDESRTVQLNNVSYSTLLNNLLTGSSSNFRSKDGVYIIGERTSENLRITKVVQLKLRSVIDLTNIIPAKLREGVEIKEFADLNSLLISGSAKAIDELEAFIFDIDKVVPMILIEVMIVDSRSTATLNTGVSAGLGTEPSNTGGSILPGYDMSLSSSSLNKLISSFNGFGWFNMGKVTPNFYFTIKALESDGIVKIRSTPKLSTLNGHEATITIGNTEYYLEETNSVIGTQNPQNIRTQNYKPVNVNFTLKIKPIVSGDEQITLDILVEQSDFTARISKEAPPGSISRNFTSLIRIRNGEMVLLGGLEEKKVNDNTSGLPLLSKIPVLKWLVSNRLKENSFDKLNIFIKPTIIY